MSLNTDLDPDRTATEEGRQAMRLTEDLHKERQRVKELEAALRDIATIAHCGGLFNMDERSALASVRKITIPFFDKTTPFSKIKNPCLKAT